MKSADFDIMQEASVPSKDIELALFWKELGRCTLGDIKSACEKFKEQRASFGKNRLKLHEAKSFIQILDQVRKWKETLIN